MRRRTTAAGLVLCAILALGACTSDHSLDASPTATAPSARALTTEEAQILAVMRFRNFDDGARAVSFEVADGAQKLRFEGWMDYASRSGAGALTSDDGAALLQWNPGAVAVRERLPAENPSDAAEALDDRWTVAGLDPGASPLHALLAIVAELGADRPENPLLLQQTGALRLGTDSIDGESVTLFAGPTSDEPRDPDEPIDADAANAHYALAEDGTLLRADLRLASGAQWTRIHFGDAEGVRVPDAFGEDVP